MPKKNTNPFDQMPKKNQKKKQKQKKSRKESNKAPPMRQKMLTTGGVIVRPSKTLLSRVCSITDPFCDHAVGASYPDSYGTITHCYQTRTLQPVITGAAGYNIFILEPQTGNPINRWSYSAGAGTQAIGATYSPGTALDATWGTNVAAADTTRVISYGVRWVCTLPMTAAGGVVKIAAVPEGSLAGSTIACDLVAGYYGQVETWDVRNPFCAVGKPTSEKFKQFYTAVSSTTPGSDNAWNSMILSFAGPPDTGLGYLEVFINYEWTRKPGLVTATTGTYYETPNIKAALPAKAIQAVTGAAREVNRLMPLSAPITSGNWGERVEDLAMRALSNLGESALEGLAGLFL